MCDHRNVSPSSHIVPEGLEKTSEDPIAFGGFADVWEGSYGGRKVCVKASRIYNPNRITNGRNNSTLICDIPNIIVRPIKGDILSGFLRRSGRLEETETSKRCSILGGYNNAFTDRVGMNAQRHFDGPHKFTSTGRQDKPRACTTVWGAVRWKKKNLKTRDLPREYFHSVPRHRRRSYQYGWGQRVLGKITI